MTVIPLEERARMAKAFRRGLRAVLAIGLAAFVLVFLHRFFTDKFYDRTGEAQWLWQPHRFASRQPVAFFAAKTFDLGPAPSWLRIKVAADPEYTLFFNGREIAGGAPQSASLDIYDLSKLARPGRNRIVASLRSPEGVGGLLLAIDTQPERQNTYVTDGSWKIYRRWDERLLGRDLPGAEAPMLIGQPPVGRWNYPPSKGGQPYGDARFIGNPASVREIDSSLEETRTINGVAVASRRPARAVLFDFGRVVEGRGRIEMKVDRPQVVKVRYIESETEVNSAAVRDLVVAAGEQAVVDPQRHRFRYMVVFEERALASVISETPM